MTDLIEATAAEPAGVQSFTFGEPEAVLDKRDIFGLFAAPHNGKWYEPPVPPAGLGKAYRMSPHHQSAIVLKRNLLTASFVPSRWLSRTDFARWAQDWLIFGNAFLERVDSLGRTVAALKPSPAAYTRVGVEAGTYFFVKPDAWMNDAHEFRPGSVHHLIEWDPLQEIYGVPEYLSAMQAGLLNEAATIFRRRYYVNGSHAGYVMLVTDAAMTNEDADAVRRAMREAKGPGNFRNFFMHLPNGKADSVKVIPIAEVGAKDNWLDIKEVSRDDVLAAHRVPPQLLGVVPKNTGGFGNVIDAARTFYELEIASIQQRLLEVNDWLGLPAVAFTPLSESGMLASAPTLPKA